MCPTCLMCSIDIHLELMADFSISQPDYFRCLLLFFQRCGLKKLIYVVEGDPNSSEAAESIKTADEYSKDYKVNNRLVDRLNDPPKGGKTHTRWQGPREVASCFTTEILEGFDVQRTTGLGDTLRRYGYLTQAITQYYRLQFTEDKQNSLGVSVCPPFDEFIRRCQNLDKMTVSDVFAIQLMQVLT
ncbi:hypothetical protein TEA_000828 [Camellia sinensis var. sinensis]|uniref:Crossover junction endonuclease MUS81 n=1 Tax=Camellia sinensis var. sinensis TaxID=542762 RepID=A0A4S4DRB1_CAMSN|nr:hypothetical protein TEA_000828 [Camellia sinensis var. sinensis]